MQFLCSTISVILKIEKTLFAIHKNERHYSTNDDNDIKFDRDVCHSTTNLEKNIFEI